MATHAPITGASTRAPAINRRKLLGALAAAPAFALTQPALAHCPTSTTAWNRAFAEWQNAKQSADAFTATYVNPYVDHLPVGAERSAAIAAIPAWVWERDEGFGEREADLEDALMAMPAPHVAALAWKLERILESGEDGCTAGWSAEFVAPVLADAHRLAGVRH